MNEMKGFHQNTH